MEPTEQSESTEAINDKPKTYWITTKKRVGALRFHPKNPRVITEERVGKMKESIAEFGYMDLVSANLDDVIISGHRRVAALLDWGQEDETIEVRVPNRLLSKEEHEKLMLVSNRLGEKGWDWDKLANEFDEALLEEVGFTEIDFVGEEKEDDQDTEKKEKVSKNKDVECPQCHHAFTVEL